MQDTRNTNKKRVSNGYSLLSSPASGHVAAAITMTTRFRFRVFCFPYKEIGGEIGENRGRRKKKEKKKEIETETSVTNKV